MEGIRISRRFHYPAWFKKHQVVWKPFNQPCQLPANRPAQFKKHQVVWKLSYCPIILALKDKFKKHQVVWKLSEKRGYSCFLYCLKSTRQYGSISLSWPSKIMSTYWFKKHQVVWKFPFLFHLFDSRTFRLKSTRQYGSRTYSAFAFRTLFFV